MTKAVDIYGLIISDAYNYSAATFDAMTPLSNQFLLGAEDPASWAALYILEEICHGTNRLPTPLELILI